MEIAYEITGDLKVLWGMVNAAHTDFADLAEAVAWAQSNGYTTVYLPAGVYELRGTAIDIYTHNFALLGAGERKPGTSSGGTLIQALETCYSTVDGEGCAIRVRPPVGETLIKGVRLAGFTPQRAALLGEPYPEIRKGGIYLQDCHGVRIEGVQADDWATSDPVGYGFKAYNHGLDPQPAGGIVFHLCGGTNCFYGIWLSGDQPLQRCSLFAPSFVAQQGPNALANSYGVYIEKAKGALVLGGEFSNYDRGVYVGPSTTNETQLSQIVGVKFDMVNTGVYIDEGARQTQVLAVTRSAGQHVVDQGIESLILGYKVEAGYSTDSLIVSNYANQFPANVDVQGGVDV